VKYGEWEQLVDLTIDAVHYEHVEHFADDYLITDILRKSPNLPLGVNRAKVAYGSFIESELRCYYTNERLLNEEKPQWFTSYVQMIERIVGPLCAEDLQFVEEMFSFGPGATTGVRGTGSVKSDKVDAEMHLTESLMPYFIAVLGPRWARSVPSYKIVEGSKFTTVPKSAKTDRGICIEPTMNIFCQKGVGALLRRKLRRAGVDLNDQSVNQNLAKRAHVERLATIDLSSASDSVSAGLVFHSLPPRWFELLELFRSPTTSYTHPKVKGQEDKVVTHRLEKFSSMGNGYTFELESLLFIALVRSVVPEKEWHLCNVYGDDIICPQQYAREVIDRLVYLGFKTNSRKSFLAGCFYESCGTDWYKGVEVRPFHLTGRKGSIPYALQIANKLRLYAAKRGGQFGYADSLFKTLWYKLKRLIPLPWSKTCVPSSYGDTGLIIGKDESLRLRASRNIPGCRDGVHVVMKPETRDKRSWGVVMSALLDLRYLRKPHWMGRPRLQLAAWELLPYSMMSEEDWNLTQKVNQGIATYGREPRRGYLGKPQTKRSPMYWVPDGVDWL
jgi:hypothetical protein